MIAGHVPPLEMGVVGFAVHLLPQCLRKAVLAEDSTVVKPEHSYDQIIVG